MTFVEKIFHNLSQDDSKPCVHEVHGDRLETFSRHDFQSLISRAQQKLQSLNVQKGDRVVLLGSNSAKWIACDLAILSLGAITVPLYNRQDPKELAFMANDCEPSLFIYSTEDLKTDVTKHWDSSCPSILLANIFELPGSSNIFNNQKSSDVATIIYTSGTSGHPKGVILTAENIGFMLERTTNQLYSAKKNTTNDDRVFHFLPLCFAGSRMMLWTQLFRGNPVYASMDLKNLVQEMGTAAPEFYLNVPAILERIRTGVETKVFEKGGLIAKLYKKAITLGFQDKKTSFESFTFSLLSKLILKSIRKKIGKNLRFLICGSAALHPDTQKWFNLLGITVLQVYGLTETTAIITMDDPSDIALGLVGKPIDGVTLSVSSEGELLCKGPNIFPGYWKRDAETKACFDSQGWFKTGDLAEITSTGHIKIMGRTKNMIIPTSGHNIVPEPIEEQLVQYCSKIEHAVLVGHGKPFLGIIVTGKAEPTEIETAIEKINQNVPHYRKIKTYYHYQDGFTVENGFLTANQKIKRKTVESLLQEKIDGMYQQAAR